MKKRIFAAILAALMLVPAVCLETNAEILFTDPFDVETDYWLYDYTEFKIINCDDNCVLEGQRGAVVHQSQFESADEETVGFKHGKGTVATGTFWIDVYTKLIDSYTSDTAGAGLWWKNIYHEKNDGAESSDIFTLKYYPATSQIVFRRDFPGSTTDEECIIAIYDDPRQRGENMKSMIPVTLGMRIERGKISAFVDGKYIASFEDASLGIEPCPVLLWNTNLHVYFDNYNLGDLDELPIVSTIPGDADGNGKINARDIIAVMRYMLGNTPEGFNEKAADMDANGKVNAKDIIAIMRVMLSSN